MSSAVGPVRSIERSRWAWLVLAAVIAGALVVAAIGGGAAATPAERARGLAESIRCPTCAGQSVADSNATAARAIRTEIARRLEAGETDAQIRDYIGGLYGEEMLLTPPSSGVAGLIWFLPVVAFVLALGGLVAAFRRWQDVPDAIVTAEDEALVARAQRAPGHGPRGEEPRGEDPPAATS